MRLPTDIKPTLRSDLPTPQKIRDAVVELADTNGKAGWWDVCSHFHPIPTDDIEAIIEKAMDEGLLYEPILGVLKVSQ